MLSIGHSVSIPFKPQQFRKAHVALPQIGEDRSPLRSGIFVRDDRGWLVLSDSYPVLLHVEHQSRVPPGSVFYSTVEGEVYEVGKAPKVPKPPRGDWVASNLTGDVKLVDMDTLEEYDVVTAVSNKAKRWVLGLVMFPMESPPDLEDLGVISRLKRMMPLVKGASLYKGAGYFTVEAPGITTWTGTDLATFSPPTLVHADSVEMFRSRGIPSLLFEVRADSVGDLGHYSDMSVVLVNGQPVLFEEGRPIPDDAQMLTSVLVSYSSCDVMWFSAWAYELTKAMLRFAKDGDRVYIVPGRSTHYSSVNYIYLDVATVVLWTRYKGRMHLAVPLPAASTKLVHLWLPN